MRNLRKTPALVALAGALALGACATATPYQPAGYNGERGGYAEQRLEANRYSVSFSGNSVTSRSLGIACSEIFLERCSTASVTESGSADQSNFSSALSPGSDHGAG